MTRIDFYVLPENSAEARLNFACKLTEKAVRHHNKVMIWVSDLAMQKALDTLLWEYRPESFLPHESLPKSTTQEDNFLGSNIASPTLYKAGLPEVVISHQQDRSDQQDMLINLSSAMPPMFSRFSRMAEIVIQQDSILKETRSRYSQLKESGYTINMHKL